MKATYTKLRDGSWGARIEGATPSKGSSIAVTKRDVCAIQQQRPRGGCSCDESCCRPRCDCDRSCNCRGGNIYDC